MLKARGAKINPREIAEKIVQNIPENELIQSTEIAGPGESSMVVVDPVVAMTLLKPTCISVA